MDSETTLLPPSPYATSTATGGRKWVYPRRFKGKFFRARLAVAIVLLLLYTALPHIRIHGLPAILLDIPARRFTLFGTQFWATDTLLLALVIIGVLVGIVALTALFGRVWCGWGCPQTVYMEFVFRPIEHWLEGQGDAQRKFNAAPWTNDKMARKGLKYFLFLIIAMVMAHTFLAYFVGVDKLEVWMTRSPFEHPLSFLVMAGVTGAILFDFIWFREQMCTLACPYGRLQSVMMDKRSLRVGYDFQRGEPRGKLQKILKEGEIAHGDCVDCKLCVQACPTGIDIRNGLQLECIGCTQCIDACNPVMEKIGKPTGLIRHTSTSELNGRKSPILRPRLFIYSGLLVIVFGTLTYKLETRKETPITILRATDAPFQVLPGGQVSNHLKVRVANHGQNAAEFTLSLLEPTAGHLMVPISPLKVEGGKIGTVDAFVTLPVNSLHDGQQTLKIEVTGNSGLKETSSFKFVGPEHPDEQGDKHGDKQEDKHGDDREEKHDSEHAHEK